jgi:hypothetical protein
MKLDTRIIDGKKPLTCFDAEEAKAFIGKACYFTNNLREYADLTTVTAKRTLGRVGSYFYAEFDSGMYAYCLPCDWVTEEKKYRPFADTKEFFTKTNFEVGDLIHIRSKLNNYEYHLLIIGWTDEGLMLGNFSEMTFDELLQKFELWDEEGGNFIPFGVEENE